MDQDAFTSFRCVFITRDANNHAPSHLTRKAPACGRRREHPWGSLHEHKRNMMNRGTSPLPHSGTNQFRATLPAAGNHLPVPVNDSNSKKLKKKGKRKRCLMRPTNQKCLGLVWHVPHLETQSKTNIRVLVLINRLEQFFFFAHVVYFVVPVKLAYLRAMVDIFLRSRDNSVSVSVH